MMNQTRNQQPLTKATGRQKDKCRRLTLEPFPSAGGLPVRIPSHMMHITTILKTRTRAMTPLTRKQDSMPSSKNMKQQDYKLCGVSTRRNEK